MEISASHLQILGGLAAYACIALIFVVISMVDLRARRIPNYCIVALVGLRMVVCLFDSVWGSPARSFASLGISLLVSGGITFCLIMLKTLLDHCSGRESLGWGDVKLLAAGCLFLNLDQAFIALFVASVLGIVLGVCVRLVRKDNTFPFGPALCAGLMIGLFA